MKTLLKIVAVLVVVVALGFWFLASNIDGLVKQIIEEVGTETLATDVSLGSVKVELGSESGAALNDLTIANPPGWSTPNAFEFGTIGATIESASLPKDVVVIPKVLIENAQMTFEQKAGGSNLQNLLDNMEDDSADGIDGTAEGEGEDALLAIGELRLTSVGVTAISDQLEKPIEFTLDEVVVRNIGTAEKGVTADQAAEQIIVPVIDAALKQSKDQVKQIIEDKVRAELDKKKDEAADNFKKSLRDKLRN